MHNNNGQSGIKFLTKEVTGLGHDYPPSSAQLGIKGQVTLWGYFPQNPLFSFILASPLNLSKESFFKSSPKNVYWFYFIFFFRISFIFRERGTSMCKIHWLVASCTPLAGDLARNPGICPDWELNWWPFSSQAGTQSTELHQPGLFIDFREEGGERERETSISCLPYAL